MIFNATKSQEITAGPYDLGFDGRIDIWLDIGRDKRSTIFGSPDAVNNEGKAVAPPTFDRGFHVRITGENAPI